MSEPVTLEEARAAKAQALEQLRDLPGLTGVGITSDDVGYGVKINLRQSLAKNLSIPSQIGRVPVVIEVVGAISKRLGKVDR